MCSNPRGRQRELSPHQEARLDAEVRRLTREVAVLCGEKRRLQESLRQLTDADCRKAEDLRRQHDTHEAQLRRAERDGRRQLVRLVSELKIKDRVIARLKKDRRHYGDCLLRKRHPLNVGDDWVAAFCSEKPLPPQSADMYKQLYLEHLQLQRAFCLLHQLTAGDGLAQPLWTWMEEKRRLESAVNHLRAEMERLQKELRLAKDDNDLLEFCVLELENQEQVSVTTNLVERGVNTESPCECPLEEPLQVKMEDIGPDITTTHQDSNPEVDIKLDVFDDDNKALRTFADESDLVADSTFQSPVSEKDDMLKELQIQLHHQESLNTDLKVHCANLRLICNDLVAKVAELESARRELSRLCSSESPEQLKLCADYMSARQEIHRLSAELQRNEGVSQRLLADSGRSDPCEEPDSIGAATSEDEGLGDESRRSDSTGPGSFLDVRVSDEDLTNAGAKRQEARDPNVWSEMVDDAQCKEQDSQSVVRMLRENIGGKETQIKQLLDENCTLHKTNREMVQEVRAKETEVDALQGRLEALEKRRASLAEQVLELEEAENDARLESQQLQEKLTFLQEKDQHFQQELHEIKTTLDSTTAQLNSREESEAELQARIAYMNVLIEKYEEQIQTTSLPGCVRCSLKPREDSGAQTEDWNGSMDPRRDSVEHRCGDSTRCKTSRTESRCTQTDWTQVDTNSSSVSRYWDLCRRLHTLEKDDVQLRGQLHQVDEINLALWQKLHALEDNVERCRKENIESDWDSEQEQCDSATEQDSRTPAGDSRCGLEARIVSLECSERELKERLVQLEKINLDFETELEVREKLHREKEAQRKDWTEKETIIKHSIAVMEDEMSTLASKVSGLEEEKLELHGELEQLRSELQELKVKHEEQLEEMRVKQREEEAEQEARITNLVAKERDYMRQIQELEGRDSEHRCDICRELESLREELGRERAEAIRTKQDFLIQMDLLKESQMMKEQELKSEIEARDHRELEYIRDLLSLKDEQDSLQEKLREKGEELNSMQAKHEEQMKLLEEEHHLVEEDLKWKLKRMEENAAITTDALEKERKQLEMDLEANVQDLKCKEEGYKSRIAELERLVTHLRSEADDIAGNDGGSLAFSCFERERLMQRLQDLLKKETKLRDKVEEMEQKEAAYKETLAHADKIVSSLERGYKEQIEELEMSEQSLKQRVTQLEENEAHLKRALHHERRSSDGRKPSDLVAELMEAEKRENTLKENLEQLQASQREMTLKIKEMEKTETQLEEQLRDQDELLRTAERLQLELEGTRKEATRLQRSEGALQVALQQADQLLQQRDRQLRNEADLMQTDKELLEETVSQLRRQVRDLEVEMECGRESTEGERLSDVAQQRARTKQPGEDCPEMDDTPVADHIRTIGELQRMEAEMGLEAKVDKTSSSVQTVPLHQFCTCQQTQTETRWDKASGGADVRVQAVGEEMKTTAEDGMDARLQLEECMIRAMVAMQLELQQKAFQEDVNNHQNEPIYCEMNSVNTDSMDECSLNDWSGTFKEFEGMNVSQDVPLAQPEQELISGPPAPPANFRVLQEVGNTTLLVEWDYPGEYCTIEGFEIFVDGELHDTVTSDRKKALISGVNLTEPVAVSICAVSSAGLPSDLQIIHYTSDEAKSRDIPARTVSR